MTYQLREAVVDLDAIRENTSLLRSRSGAAEVMAVVKADGYGHGLVPSARAALDGGASWLGVALVSEARELRASGVQAPVVAWLTSPSEDFGEALRDDIDLSVNTVEGLAAVRTAAVSVGRTARVHLKIDTGLGRGGSTTTDWPQLVEQARKAEIDGAVSIVGVWSHLAYADAPGHPTIDRQLLVFREAIDLAEGRGLAPEVRHLANSAATLTRPEAHFDLTRPGLALYGLSPVPHEATAPELGLRPAMTVQARFVLVKRVPAGQGVSYQHQYVTPRPTALGLLPLGYADGIPRAATNRGPVLAAGRRRKVAGVVCMDQFVVDVGHDPCQAGDLAVLFGPGEQGEPTAQDWAEATDTISYEVVTRIGPRVARRYVGQDA
jgi:alanine racemase